LPNSHCNIGTAIATPIATIANISPITTQRSLVIRLRFGPRCSASPILASRRKIPRRLTPIEPHLNTKPMQEIKDLVYWDGQMFSHPS
jgi:hypothetical protein